MSSSIYYYINKYAKITASVKDRKSKAIENAGKMT